MVGRVDPMTLTPLAFPPRPDPRKDWIDDPAAIAEAFGRDTLTEGDRLRLRAGWKYSPACAEHFEVICRLFLTHSKGRWAGQPCEWHDWQRHDWIRPIFGWHDLAGIRSVNRVYLECGKKSGKSTYAAAVAIYMALFAGEQGADVFCLASTERQARIVQIQVEQMVRASQALADRGRIRHGWDIRWPQTNACVTAMSSKGESGHNPYCLIFDELHEWRGNQCYERWTLGSVARDGWLHLAITNAGDDTESVCWRLRSTALAAERGELDLPNVYGKVYAVSRDEAEAEVEAVAGGATRLPVAARCNPGLGTVLKESELVGQIRQAAHVPAELPNLLRFIYCVWRTRVDLNWLTDDWPSDAGFDSVDDLVDDPIWLGLDLASVIDLAALVAVAKRDGRPEYRVHPWYWVPAVRAAELRKWTAIDAWQGAGAIEIAPGHQLDFKPIEDTICDLCATHDVRGLVYDPREASDLVERVEARTGIDVVPFKQSQENYHAPTDRFEAAVKSGNLAHSGNLILTWQARHAACIPNSHDRKKPQKPNPVAAPHLTVDGVQAAVMGFSLAMSYEPDSGEVLLYELD